VLKIAHVRFSPDCPGVPTLSLRGIWAKSRHIGVSCNARQQHFNMRLELSIDVRTNPVLESLDQVFLRHQYTRLEWERMEPLLV